MHFCMFARQLARIIACALACTFHPQFLERSQKKNRRLQNLVCRKRTPGDQRESGANKNSLFDVHFCTPAVCIFRTQNFWGEREKKIRGSRNLGRPMTIFGVPLVGQNAQPLRVFWKARGHKCAPVGMHFCTPAVRRMGWGRRFEDGITVGWEGRRVERVAEWVEVWWDGFCVWRLRV